MGRRSFQSLKGILVNFNRSLLATGNRYVQFQSLKGILVNFNPPSPEFLRLREKFQSLKGILVNFNRFRVSRIAERVCFNPSKGFW
ncbi:Epoxyqueuosine (oQ) reductase QueG [Geitlerinema sp. FC II]|nr:Epoxyqueuosine (oQ) reductase QueG [Geitlerinema sp. FC II]